MQKFVKQFANRGRRVIGEQFSQWETKTWKTPTVN